jgi:hypothetical protein
MEHPVNDRTEALRLRWVVTRKIYNFSFLMLILFVLGVLWLHWISYLLAAVLMVALCVVHDVILNLVMLPRYWEALGRAADGGEWHDQR